MPSDSSTFENSEERVRLGIFARRARRFLLGIAAVIAFVVLEEVCCDWEQRQQVCTNCGARRDARRVEIFGRSLNYSVAIKEGAVSQFIQASDGAPCSHPWETFLVETGGLISQHGHPAGPRLWLVDMERFYPDLKDLLQKRAASDPTFLPTLKDFIRTDDRVRYECFLDEFYTWVGSQTSRPADEK